MSSSVTWRTSLVLRLSDARESDKGVGRRESGGVHRLRNSPPTHIPLPPREPGDEAIGEQAHHILRYHACMHCCCQALYFKHLPMKSCCLTTIHTVL